MLPRNRMFGLFLLFCLVLAPSLPAQSVSAEISGIVEDASGAAVAGATIRLEDPEKGWQASAVSSEAGMFRFGGLAPGRYRLSVEKSGFRPVVFERILLLGSQRADLSLRMEVGSLTQEIQVVGASEELRTVVTHGSRGGSLTAVEASTLPLLQGGAGRNFGALMFSIGGVAPRRTHAPFTVNGMRPVGSLNLMVDSAEFNDFMQGAVIGRGTTEQPVSMEAVESFEAQTSSFKAEHGRATGGVVNLLTRSGTNDWRGHLYYLWQNSALNARNALLTERPPAYTHVPGMTLGGPLRRNRVFFFGALEAPVRNNYSGSTRVLTLTAAQRAQAVPAIRPLADIFPEPNLPGTNLFATQVPNPQTLKSVTGRVDAALSERHRLSLRSNAMKAIGYKFTAIPAASRDSHSMNRLLTLALDSVPAPAVLNQLKVAHSLYDNPIRLENEVFGDPALHGRVGLLRVTGLTPVVQFRTNQLQTLHNYSVSNDASFIRGRHQFKGGFVFRRLHANLTSETNFNGTMVFRNVADFLAGRPLSYSINVGDPRMDLRNEEYGFYFQDDWKAVRNLTLNLGIRHEYFGVPYDKWGKLPNMYRPDRNNWAPRFGFAYDVGGALKTVVRGGYGWFYGPILMNQVRDAYFSPPFIRSLVIASPPLPPSLGSARAGLNRMLIHEGARNPLVQNWNLTVERGLSSSVVAAAAYVGARATSLHRTRQPNGGPNLAQNLRPDPAQGVISRMESSAGSAYHSLQLTLRGSLRNGVVFRSAYTFGKSLDDASTYSDTPLDERNLRLDRGRSDFDVRHLWNGHVIYPLPWLKKRRWLGGWQVAALATVRSGQVFTITSNTNNLEGTLNNRGLDIPGSLLRGSSRQQWLTLAPGVTAAQLIPPAGSLGTLPRNSHAGPFTVELNGAVMKNFALTESLRLELRAEAFNIPNRVNYNAPISNLGDPLFGTIQSAGDPRNFQISLRLFF